MPTGIACSNVAPPSSALLTGIRFIGLSILGIGTTIYTLAYRRQIQLCWWHLTNSHLVGYFFTKHTHSAVQTDLISNIDKKIQSCSRRSSDDVQMELDNVRAELSRLTHELEDRNRAWIEQQMEAVEAENRINELQETTAVAEERKEELKDELRVLQAERDDAHRELDKMKARWEEAQIHLSSTSRKGSPDPTTFTLTDSATVDEVVEMLCLLNEQIRQVSASVVELFPKPISSKRPTSPMDPGNGSSYASSPSTSSVSLSSASSYEPEESEEFSHLSEIFGPKITDLLLACYPDFSHPTSSGLAHENDYQSEDSSQVLQSVIQAYIGVYIVWMIASWHLEPLGEDNILADLYESLQDTESQSVAGHWRSLARKHIDLILPHTSDASALSEHFVQASINVLAVSGRIPTSLTPTTLVSTREEIINTIREKLGEKMGDVMRLVFKIKKAIGQDVIYKELEVVSVPEEQPFDIRTMEVDLSMYSSEKGKAVATFDSSLSGLADQRVMMTTELGLRGHRLDFSSASSSSSYPQDEWETIVYLRPKVILERDLQKLSR